MSDSRYEEMFNLGLTQRVQHTHPKLLIFLVKERSAVLEIQLQKLIQQKEQFKSVVAGFKKLSEENR